MSGEGKSAEVAQGAAEAAGGADLRLALRARRLLAELWKIPAGEVNGEAVQALSAAIVAEGLADLTTQPGRGAVLHAFAEMARHVCEPDGDGDGRAHDRLCGAMLDAKREWTDIEARLAAAETRLVAAGRQWTRLWDAVEARATSEDISADRARAALDAGGFMSLDCWTHEKHEHTAETLRSLFASDHAGLRADIGQQLAVAGAADEVNGVAVQALSAAIVAEGLADTAEVAALRRVAAAAREAFRARERLDNATMGEPEWQPAIRANTEALDAYTAALDAYAAALAALPGGGK